MANVNASPASQTSGRPDVSVVVVTWNSAGLIGDCLASIAGGCGSWSHETIVVDNASSDGTALLVADHDPAIRLIKNDSNVGFATACSQGMAEGSGRYVMALNPDTQVMPRAIEKLVDCLEADSAVGIAGPRLTLFNGTTQLTSARVMPGLSYAVLYCGLPFRRIEWVRRIADQRFICPYDLNESQDVEAVSGAAMLIRRQVVDAIGALDQEYRHTGEDVDYCLTTLRAGWRIRYVHDAIVRHHSGASAKKDPYRVEMDGILSVHRYYEKNWSPMHSALFRLMVLTRVPSLLLGGVLSVAARRAPAADLRSRARLAEAIIRFQPYRQVAVSEDPTEA